MELFEEALRRWEQALTFRSRQAEEETCGSVKLGAGDAIAEESVDVRTFCFRLSEGLLSGQLIHVVCFPKLGLYGRLWGFVLFCFERGSPCVAPAGLGLLVDQADLKHPACLPLLPQARDCAQHEGLLAGHFYPSF